MALRSRRLELQKRMLPTTYTQTLLFEFSVWSVRLSLAITNRIEFLSFLSPTKMLQFREFLFLTEHNSILGSKVACTLPRHIAAYRGVVCIST